MNRLEHAGTEMEDLNQQPGPVQQVLSFVRDARLFSRHRDLVERISKQRDVMTLAPHELLHPPVPADFAIRRGKLRLSEFLPDGREVTRCVLQAGGIFRTRATTDRIRPESEPGQAPQTGALQSRDCYDLSATVLMALGNTELWTWPANTLDPGNT